MGEITASNVQNWLSGRILLIENLAQTLARDHSPETTQALLEQPLLGSTFLFTYLGQTDGTYTARPTSDLPADYDPRRRPGTTPPPAPARPPSPNPTWSRPSTSWY
ncbi:Uncharacterised protein [Pseudomonas aeruginosa]|nr:Uncharacterised protein [Pseudomonas aeruginosa]